MKKLIFILLLLPLFVNAQNSLFTVPGQLKIKKVPNASATGDSALIIDLTGNVKKGFPVASAVLSVGGTANRITSTGGIHPVIDISASYVGQSSITTLGTIVSGVWHGTVIDPAYLGYTFNNGLTNTSGTVQLGGTLNKNMLINNAGFTFSVNQPSGGSAHILELESNSSIVGTLNMDGRYYGAGISNLAGGDLGLVQTLSTGTFVRRNNADAPSSAAALTIINTNVNSNATLIQANDALRGVYQLQNSGTILESALTTSAAGNAVNHTIQGALKPIANGDGLEGLRIAPVFGTTTIATLGGISGGTGYPSSFNALLVGGTGQLAEVSGTAISGVVNTLTLANGGINYTAGDVLKVIYATTGIVDSTATVTVASVNTYTGTININTEFDNAPILLHSISTPTTFMDGMLWFDGTHFYSRISNSSYQLDQQVISNSYTLSATAQSTFTISIGSTMPNNTYKVNFKATSSTAASTPNYVTNKTTTSFDVVFTSAVTGVVSGDWEVFK